MSTLTIAEAREHLDELCKVVAETGEPVMIDLGGRRVALVAQDVYEKEFGPVARGDESSARVREAPADEAEMKRRLYAAVESKEEDDVTITTTLDELCKAVGIDANKL